MLKRTARLIAVLLAILILTGCGEPEPQKTTDPGLTATTIGTQPTQPNEPTDPTGSTDPTAPSDPEIPEPPEEPEPLPELDALTILTCVEFDAFPKLLSLGNGLVVASRNTYSELQGRMNETLVIDIFKDEVVASSLRAHSMELVMRRFADGAIVLAEPDSGKYFIYDENLTLKSYFAAPDLDGFFSQDRKNYYYLEGDSLYCMDVQSKNTAPVAMAQTLRFESLVDIHPDKDYLVARVYLDSHTSDYGVAVIDAKDGNVLLLRDNLTHVWLTEDRFAAVEMSTTNMGFNLYYGSLSGGDIQRITSDSLYSSSVGYSVLPGSDYLLWRYDPDDGVKATKIYDLSNGAAFAELKDLEFNAALFSPIYLPHEQAILGYYSIKEAKTPENPYPREKLQFALINPHKLSYYDGPAVEVSAWQDCIDVDAVDYST